MDKKENYKKHLIPIHRDRKRKRNQSVDMGVRFQDLQYFSPGEQKKLSDILGRPTEIDLGSESEVEFEFPPAEVDPEPQAKRARTTRKSDEVAIESIENAFSQGMQQLQLDDVDSNDESLPPVPENDEL